MSGGEIFVRYLYAVIARRPKADEAIQGDRRGAGLPWIASPPLRGASQ